MLGVREDRITVPSSLAPWVASISEITGRDGEVVVRLPDAMSSLVVCEDARGRIDIVAVGPIQRAFYKPAASLRRYTRVAFRPGQARGALGVSPRELVGGAANLAALWGDAALPVLDAVAGAKGHLSTSVVGALAAALAPRFGRATSIAGSVVHRAARILQGGEAKAPPIRAVAARLGVSERFLRDAFQDEVGLAPKRYARIARIRGAAAAALGDAPWATLATTHGFFDQPHLTAEFRELLGTTPAAFRAGDVPRSASCAAR